MAAAMLNPESFARTLESMVEEAHKRGRGDDLARIVQRVLDGTHPKEVTPLAALMFMVDQEFLHPLQEAIDALRRWHKKKGTPITDDEVFASMMEIYAAAAKA